MTNRPIPRRGLLGCWFLDDRGITYDAGANEAIDRSGQGNHATYQNGVTVGVSGDPSRDFGAADFDAGSNQFALVDDPLGVDGDFALVMLLSVDSWDNNSRLFSQGGVLRGFATGSVGEVSVDVADGGGSITRITTDLDVENEFFLLVISVNNGEFAVRNGAVLKAETQISGHISPTAKLSLMAKMNGFKSLDGQVAAAAKYDLTVPDAPEPSEIARRWDRLTDIPATR